MRVCPLEPADDFVDGLALPQLPCCPAGTLNELHAVPQLVELVVCGVLAERIVTMGGVIVGHVEVPTIASETVAGEYGGHFWGADVLLATPVHSPSWKLIPPHPYVHADERLHLLRVCGEVSASEGV